MIKSKITLPAAIVATVVVAQMASAQFVTNTVTVRNARGVGVGVVYGTPTYSTSYDKPNIRCDQTTAANKAWIGWDLSQVWATYGKANLVDASLTLWGENGVQRTFWVSALKDSEGLDGWGQTTITWNNAPGNSATQTYPGTTALNQAFDWARCYNGTNLWEVSSGNNALTADLGTNYNQIPSTSFDQCARYVCTNTVVKSNLVVWLKTDSDGWVTLMASGSGNQNWWVGTNGYYANDISLGYTNKTGPYTGDVIRDSPTLTLTFVAPAGSPAAPVFTNILLSGGSVILRGSNGVPQGAYQMLRSADASQPVGTWQNLGITSFDANGSFSFTNTLPAGIANFYRLKTLSTGPVFPPEITSDPQDLTIAAGQNAVFNVTATGSDLTYRWYYDLNTLLAVGSSSAFALNNAQVSNSGSYFVTVSNLLGVVSSAPAALTVTNSSLLAAPTGLTATAGALQVSLGWNAVSGATNYIVKRSASDGGPYDNIATNLATSYVDTGLQSGAPYYYVVSAVDLVGNEGFNSVQASATPTNAPPIAVSNFGFETPTTSTYIFNPSGGSWTFSPQGNGASGISANGSGYTSGNPDAPQGLQVGFIQGTNKIAQTINGFVPGVTYAITFSAANRGRSGYTTPQIWDVQIDGVTKATFSNAPITYTDYTVNFTATAPSHLLTFLGKYVGDATVFLDNVRIASLVQPPAVLNQPTNVTASVGWAAVFSVTTSGAPPLRYQWYYNTNTLLIGQTNFTLTVNNVQLANGGKYSVTVTNTSGSVTSILATLTVTTNPPTITAQPANVGCAVGQAASFSVGVTGSLPLFYQWYYNTNTVLTGETNSTLTLVSTTTNLAGKYSVIATNQFGVANSAYATLTVTNGVLAFPEAEGYGKYTSGGRGGTVYEVTSLASGTGAGTFGAAISASGRTIVFRVAGTIVGNYNITKDNITIAGQTAPGDGICIKGRLGVSANNIIIRYIRCRQDTSVNQEDDAIGGRYYRDIIVDHVSASWSGDEVMSFYLNKNVTIQWSMITEACAKFINGANTGHQFGGIWGNEYGTYHHNLIADNVSRNIRWASGCRYNDYRNNVIYNWNYESCYGGEAYADDYWNFSTINMIGNYYKAGPATQSGVRSRIANPSARNSDDKGSWYVSGNYVDGYPSVTANNWTGVAGSSYIKLNAPWNAMPINEQSPADAYTAVLAKVGCFKPNRDAVDNRIIYQVTTGTATNGVNGILTYASDGGGWPTLATGPAPADTDHDGMPDTWENSNSLSPTDPSDRNGHGLDPNYTNLEVYLNELGAF